MTSHHSDARGDADVKGGAEPPAPRGHPAASQRQGSGVLYDEGNHRPDQVEMKGKATIDGLDYRVFARWDEHGRERRLLLRFREPLPVDDAAPPWPGERTR